MPKRRKNEYKERRVSEFRDEYTRICETNRVRIIRIFGTGSSPGSRWSRYGQARRARFTTSDLFQSRSKDLERTEPPYLHTPPISMSCSPFPLRRLPPPSRTCCFFAADRVRCKLQYSRCYSFEDMKIYAVSPSK